MTIYWSIIIPICCCIYICVYKKSKSTWWEILLLIGIGALVIFGANSCATNLSISDKEYWGEIAYKAVHSEEWNEEVEYTETDAKGRTVTKTRIEYHPEYYRLYAKSDFTSLTRKEYIKIKTKWQNEKYNDLNRGYTIRGGIYYTKWNGKKETAEPFVSIHRYPNKTQVSSSIYKFPEVSEQDIKHYGLFDYPKLSSHQIPTIIGIDANKVKKENREFLWLNGHYGPIKKVRLWVLIFKNKPYEAAKMQEAYWDGGNKNEVIYCIGIDDSNNVKWGYTISWTDNEIFKVKATKFINHMNKLDLMSLAKWTDKNIHMYHKRDFTKEFEHLEVELSWPIIIITYILVLIFCLGLTYWIINNKYTD